MATEEKKFLDLDGLSHYDKVHTEKVFDKVDYDNYYEEVTYTKERHYDTDCYFVTIPMADNDGNEIELHLGDANSGSPITYARENHTTFTSNATLNMGGAIGVGSLIIDGEIVRNIDTSSVPYDANVYLGIKENRVLKEYQVNQTTAQDMLNDGCLQAWYVYYKILDNGTVLDMSQVVVGDAGVPTARHPRQCLGQKTDGTIIMLSCDGRTSINAGLTSEETAQLLLDKGCVNAWNLDGGGSTSTEIRESKLNRNIDNDGTKDRTIRWTLNVKKPTVNKTLGEAFSKISIEKQNIIQQIIPYINGEIAGVVSKGGADIRGADLNLLTDKLLFGYGNNLTNGPTGGTAGYVINIPHTWDEWRGKYSTQIFISRDTGNAFRRVIVNETPKPWRHLGGLDRLMMRSSGSRTLASDNVYEALKLEAFDSNNPSLFSKVDYDSGTGQFTKFKMNVTGSCMIRAQVQVNAAQSGDKFVQIFRGETGLGGSITKAYAEAGHFTIITTEHLVTDLTANNEFSLRLYGTTGDTYERAKISVEAD